MKLLQGSAALGSLVMFWSSLLIILFYPTTVDYPLLWLMIGFYTCIASHVSMDLTTYPSGKLGAHMSLLLSPVTLPRRYLKYLKETSDANRN